MANFYGTSRTNYFRVNDLIAFTAWASALDAEIARKPDGRVALLATSDEGTFPTLRYTENDEYEEIDFIQELSAYLEPGEVAVLLEIGAEKLRYLHGHAVAIDSTGKRVDISIDDIYAKAAAEFHLPESEISVAEY